MLSITKQQVQETCRSEHTEGVTDRVGEGMRENRDAPNLNRNVWSCKNLPRESFHSPSVSTSSVIKNNIIEIIQKYIMIHRVSRNPCPISR